MASYVWATPSWYHNIKNEKPNFYMGYGDGVTESEAKQNALNDIASQIFTKIDNEIVQNKKSSNDGYEKNIEIKSSQKTKTNLSDFEVLKVEFEDGKYFVSLAYENISNIARFARKVEKLGEVKAPLPNLSIISESLLAKNIYEALGQRIDFEVIRENKAWFLRHKNAMQYIDNNQFSKLFGTILNDKLSINTNKKDNILYDGDEFLFQINSTDDGFVSIVSIYEDGTVATLIKNIKIKKDKIMKLPDDKSQSIPIAGVLEKGKETFDMYILIWSDKKLIFDRFSEANNENMEDERYKNFGEFVEFLKDKRYTALKVVTKPR